MDLKNEYKKALKALKERIRYYQKQGIITNINVPKTPKNITEKSVARLKSISGEKIKSKAIYVNLDTGESVSKKQWKKQTLKPKRKKKKQKSAIVVIDYPTNIEVIEQNFYNIIEKYSKTAREIVLDWLNPKLNEDYSGTWLAIERAAQNRIFLTESYGYYNNEGELLSALSEMSRFMGLTDEEVANIESQEDTAGMYDSEGEELY